MSSSLDNKRLSSISTDWEKVLAAHDDKSPEHEAAKLRGEIFRQYSKCVQQYLLGATRCHHAAEDLTQEFALRFVRGDFKNASPDRGRFRDYLKTSLRNLANDHFRSQTVKEDIDLMDSFQNVAATFDSLDADFSEHWRQRVLSITWQALKQFENEKQTRYYSVLFLRTEHPTSSSQELAREYQKETGTEVSADWIRQTLRRARLKFAELLTQEIGRTLKSSSKTEINDELAELGLKKYVETKE